MRTLFRIIVVSLLAILAAPISSARAFSPVAVTVGDLNGDAIDDAAVLSDAATVFLIKSNGDGTFGTFTPSTVGTRSTGGLAIVAGVFGNSTGPVSLAVASDGGSQTGGTVSVLQGNGDGSFSAARLNNVGAEPSALVVAKLKEAGTAGSAFNDLAVVASEEIADLNISLLYGSNDGTFQSDVRTTAEIDSVGIAAADFDQDGNTDLAVTNVGGGFGVAILRNDPGCSACTFPICSCTNGFDIAEPQGIGDALAIQAGDLNGDGKPDLAVLSADGLSLTIFINTTTPGGPIKFGGVSSAFPTAYDVNLASDGPNEMILADMNKDGRPDVVAINSDNSGVDVFLNNGSGGFASAPLPVDGIGDDLEALASGDFNHDGNPDIVVTDLATEQAIFLFGNGSGALTSQIVVIDIPGAEPTPVPTATARATATSTASPSPTVGDPTRTPTANATLTPAATGIPTARATISPTAVPTFVPDEGGCSVSRSVVGTHSGLGWLAILAVLVAARRRQG